MKTKTASHKKLRSAKSKTKRIATPNHVNAVRGEGSTHFVRFPTAKTLRGRELPQHETTRVLKRRPSTKLTATLNEDLITDLHCDAMASETSVGDYIHQMYITLEILARQQGQSVWQYVSNSLPQTELDELAKRGQLEEMQAPHRTLKPKNLQ